MIGPSLHGSVEFRERFQLFQAGIQLVVCIFGEVVIVGIDHLLQLCHGGGPQHVHHLPCSPQIALQWCHLAVAKSVLCLWCWWWFQCQNWLGLNLSLLSLWLQHFNSRSVVWWHINNWSWCWRLWVKARWRSTRRLRWTWHSCHVEVFLRSWLAPRERLTKQNNIQMKIWDLIDMKFHQGQCFCYPVQGKTRTDKPSG